MLLFDALPRRPEHNTLASLLVSYLDIGVCAQMSHRGNFRLLQDIFSGVRSAALQT
jgi:hypothetical protein